MSKTLLHFSRELPQTLGKSPTLRSWLWLQTQILLWSECRKYARANEDSRGQSMKHRREERKTVPKY